MPSVITMSSAESATPDAQLNGMPLRESNESNSPDGPTFSQTLSAAKSVQPESTPASKSAPSPRSPRTCSSSDDSDSSTTGSQDGKHSESKPIAATVTAIAVPVPIIPLALPMVPRSDAASNVAASTDSLAAARTGLSVGAVEVTQSDGSTSMSETTHSSGAPAAEPTGFHDLIDAAANPNDGGVSPDSANTAAATANHTHGAQTPAAPNTALEQQQTAAPNDAQGSQPVRSDAPAKPQAADTVQLQLPNTAELISVTSGGTAKASSESQNEPVHPGAQSTQPSSPSLNSASQSTIAQAMQPPLAANSNNSGNGNPQGSGAQSGNHSPTQASNQPSNSVHGSSDAKSSTGSDSSQSTQQANTPVAAQTNATAGSPFANASALVTPSAHAAAQPAAQADASVAVSTKSSASATATNQPAPLASSIPTTLPHSLSDISQATQLYQRFGGAEMHIAMNTDVLGSIDVHAVVHQGSLSATIGVQHSDIQTLLVNELPALQHSLSEKNLQVGHISVLAGSVGSGTNPNSQPWQEQGSRQSSSPVPVFRDRASPAMLASNVVNIIATMAGSSARLSVLA